MEVVETAMNIFTPEYIVLAFTLLAVVCHMTKKRKANEGSGEPSVNSGKSKWLH